MQLWEVEKTKQKTGGGGEWGEGEEGEEGKEEEEGVGGTTALRFGPPALRYDRAAHWMECSRPLL